MFRTNAVLGATLASTLIGLAVCPRGSGTAPSAGAEAAHRIDWSTVTPFAPIPKEMPAAPSANPEEAGFAREWIQRALLPPGVAVQLAMKIASKNRAADDHWALEMEEELREIIRSKEPNAHVARVFCNSVGCLCYVEPERWSPDKPVAYRELVGERGRKFGLSRSDLDAFVAGPQGTLWELTIVRRPVSP